MLRLRDRSGRKNGAGGPARQPAGGQPLPRPRLKKFRVALLLVGLAMLAFVSTVFGMMMAVSQDLPELEAFAQYRTTDNTVVVDSTGAQIGTLTSNENKILVDSGQISTNMKNAVVAIEDARFYEHRGVDFRGIGRALVQDIITRSTAQGGSTITQQFVKQATETQGERTPMQKLREAALAYHLERNWSKDRVLTAYLNTVYFGQGAYGIEAAARTYFGSAHPGCGTEAEACASVLTATEAATLAGVIQSPSAWDPKINPDDSRGRRNTVLARMRDLNYISSDQYQEGISEAMPSPAGISPPSLDSEAPYFTSWLRQQLVDRFGPERAFFGGYRVKTTLDLELQEAAETIVANHLSGIEPTAAVVVIDNETGGVKAMVGGEDYESAPFNLATQGYRQPGSSIKPFTLVTALENGISPDSVWTSEPKEFPVPGSSTEVFPVANYDDSYLGSASLRSATTYSDNSIYAELGLQLGTREVAGVIHRMGYSKPISTNPAMTLGGLRQGVTPLDWTYAFSTLANYGARVTGTLAAGYPERGHGPVSYTKVTKESTGETVLENRTESSQVISEDVAATSREMLHSVVTSGTGTLADIGQSDQWGKTGTTDDNGDAWYCGAIDLATACVWVGHADSNTPMEYEYS
ncbi:MAG TPA: transglycosylase domain-containing protein, partial [Solirubrobacterales bacterium]|nr:transglycosylase domain-containing protein [Solirubrobacterales bacterium]